MGDFSLNVNGIGGPVPSVDRVEAKLNDLKQMLSGTYSPAFVEKHLRELVQLVRETK